MTKEKQLATTQKTEVAVNQPTRLGFENQVQQEDLIIPRVKLFQGVPTEYEQYPDAKPGQLLNNITKEVLPGEFIPLIRYKQWIRFNPRDPKDPDFDKAYNPAEIIWQSSDPNDPRVIEQGKWRADGQKPLALSFLNFLCYFPGSSMPIVLSFHKTNYNVGRQINTTLELGSGNMFSHKFAINSKFTKTDQYSYYVLQARYLGKPTDEEYKTASEYYRKFANRQLDVKHEED